MEGVSAGTHRLEGGGVGYQQERNGGGESMHSRWRAGTRVYCWTLGCISFVNVRWAVSYGELV
jgi:hypothetical protein